MSRLRTLQVTSILCVGLLSGALAQERSGSNPFEGNPAAIKTGQGLFRARCVTCHGVDGRGVRGPDISGLWAGGRTDGGIFDTVRSGVPGTEMPASPVLYIPDEEIWMTVAYLRTLNAMAPPAVHGGDAENGERIFSARCASCHRVNGRGGRIGPDLSRAGASRGRSALVNQIRGANEDIAPGFEPVTLTTPEGRTIRGVKKNEDVFSVQIMDTRERIQGYLRTELKDVRDETRSLMPKFGLDILNERDLDDLLAYLSRLTGTNEVVR